MVEYKGQSFSDKYYFITSMPTSPGVSGSPLIRKDEANFQIIGLHAKKIMAFGGSFHAVLKLRDEIFEEIKGKFKSTLALDSYECGKFGITQIKSAGIWGNS